MVIGKFFGRSLDRVNVAQLLFLLFGICSTSQGIAETVIQNGAITYYNDTFRTSCPAGQSLSYFQNQEVEAFYPAIPSKAQSWCGAAATMTNALNSLPDPAPPDYNPKPFQLASCSPETYSTTPPYTGQGYWLSFMRNGDRVLEGGSRQSIRMVCTASQDLGCAYGEGGFVSCPGDTGVPPGAPLPPGTPPDGGPSANDGPPGQDSSPEATSVGSFEVGGVNAGGTTCQRSDTLPRVEAAADPVFAGTGNSYQEEVDYASPGGLAFVRRYNSSLPGWVHNWGMRIFVYGGVARAVRPDGRSHLFTGVGPGEWSAENGARERLVQLTPTDPSQALWAYFTAGDSVEYYDGRGKIISVVTPGARTFTVQYSNGLIRTVTDPFGRRLTLDYDGARRLVQVSTPDGTAIIYGYDSQSRLASATYPGGLSHSYLYENASYPQAITGLVDERGIRVATWTYDAAGRVSSNERAGTAKYQFDYSLPGATRITDPLGKVRTQAYSAVGPRLLFGGQTQPCASCIGDAASNLYDASSGMLAQSVDFLGTTSFFTNDPTRHLVLATTRGVGTPEAQTIQYQWHPVLRKPTQITEDGRTTTYAYDSLGSVLTMAVTDLHTNQTRTWSYAYGSYGLMTSMTDPAGGVWTYGYDAAGNRTLSRDPEGQETTYTYDASGRVLGATVPGGLAISYQYDARGRLLSEHRGAETTSYSYTPFGALSSVTYPSGYSVSFGYDNAQRLGSMVDNRGAIRSYGLDAAGNVTNQYLFGATGNFEGMSSQVIDSLGRVAAIGDGRGQLTGFEFNTAGLITSTSNPDNQKVRQQYDSLGRPTHTNFADGGASTQTWNSLNQITGVTDPKGVPTSYGVNAFGETTSEASVDVGQRVLDRDALGRPTLVRDAIGQVAAIDRDKLGRPKSIQYSDGQSAVFSYGPTGALAAVQDKSGSIQFSRDSQGRVISKSQVVNDSATSPSSFSVSYARDRGQLTAVTYPSGLMVAYSRDLTGQITGVSVREPGGNARHPKPVNPFVTGVSWNAYGQPSGFQWNNGDAATRQFDLDGRVTQTEFGAFSYDSVGRLSNVSQTLWIRDVDGVTGQEIYSTTALSWDARYDSRDRITSFQRPGYQGSYAYDWNGNRVTASEATTSDIDLDGDFDTDDLTRTITQTLTFSGNRVVGSVETTRRERGTRHNETSFSVQVAVDANGSLVNDGLREFQYDATGRLAKIRTYKDFEAAYVPYLHNALGQRVFKGEPTAEQVAAEDSPLGADFIAWLLKNLHWNYTQAQATTSVGTAYVYADGDIPDWALLGEYDNGSASGKGRTEYIWLPVQGGAIPIGFYRGGRLYSIHTDHQGTPRLVTDDAKRPVWQWPYSAFGQNKPSGPLARTANPNQALTNDPVLLRATAGIEFSLRFPGQMEDVEAGIFYNNMRDYLPRYGRYAQSDPAGLAAGNNRFTYTENNPLNLIDPEGLMGQGSGANATGARAPSGVNGSVGIGGSVHLPTGVGIGADAGLVLDNKGNACFYSNICYTVGPGASIGGGVVSSVGTGPLSSGVTDYAGACWTGGNGLGGSGSVLFGNDGSAQVGRGLVGAGAGASATYQACRQQLICVKN